MLWVTLPTKRRAFRLKQGQLVVLEPGLPADGLLLALGVDFPGELAVFLERQGDRDVGSGCAFQVPAMLAGGGGGGGCSG